MSIKWKVCNSRNNHVDCNWFQIKLQITKKFSRDIVSIFEIIYVRKRFRNTYGLLAKFYKSRFFL